MSAQRPESRESLDESRFIRHRLYEGNESALRRYSSLVLARPGFFSLLKHEVIGWFGPVPGALGLALRKALYRRLFAESGAGAIFGRSLTLRHADNVRLGAGVILDDYALIDARGAGQDGIRLADRVIVNRGAAIQAKVGPISIGQGTSVGAFCQIISQGAIEIGTKVSIAAETLIAGGRYEVELAQGEDDSKRRFTGGKITIEDGARIGMRSVILDGVRIGRNAIVAPGSVVFDNVAADSVVMGYPARPLRNRKTGSTAEQPGHVESRNVEARPASSTGVGADVSAIIRRYLEENHFAEFGPSKLGMDDSLFDHGVIDSIGLVGLITMLEEEFDIELDEDDLVPEKLTTVSGLTGIVISKGVTVTR